MTKSLLCAEKDAGYIRKKGFGRKDLPKIVDFYLKNKDYQFDYSQQPGPSNNVTVNVPDNSDAFEKAVSKIPVNEFVMDENGFGRYQRTVNGRVKMLNNDNSSLMGS